MNADESAGLTRLAARGWRPAAIIDGGAHKGAWTAGVRRIWPEAPVLMLEAQPDLAAALTAQSAAFGRNVIAAQALLHSQSGVKTSFYITNYHGVTTGASMYPEKTGVPYQNVVLETVTLDDLTARWIGPAFQLLKLDLQGAEKNALKGADKLLQTIEVVQMEISIHPYNEGAPLFEEMVGFMKELGFILYDITTILRDSAGILFQIDTLFIKETSPLRPAKPQFHL